MSVSLATAWFPRGEMSRFLNLYPQIVKVYRQFAISLPTNVDPGIVETLEKQSLCSIVITNDWSEGRYFALKKAVMKNTDHIHYTDFDRLLRWIETEPVEWRQTVKAIGKVDCLIIGRTDNAYATHPQAIFQTESISNIICSYFLGKSVDVSAGSKGFSFAAAKYLVENCSPGRALGTDAEWPILLNNAGFSIDSVLVRGLDWESADRFKNQFANSEEQQKAANKYDLNPEHWAERVQVAFEIVDSGVQAMERKLVKDNE